jgi:hypothetical protein
MECKPNVIPVIIKTSETKFELSRKYLGNIPGKYEVKELQKPTNWALHINFGKY